jgi:PAS domain S-box-containing protein
MSIPEESLEGFHQLQACVDHLALVASLPALWTGREASYVLEKLLEALLGILSLDFAYARLRPVATEREFDIARIGPSSRATTDVEPLRRSLAAWTGPGASPALRSFQNPVGDGIVRAATLPLGITDEMGVVVAASTRNDFPTPTEMLLLQLATGQATAGLHAALRITEQRNAAHEVDKRVAERTAGMTSEIDALRRAIGKREHSEEEHRMFSALVENSQDFIGFASLGGRVLFINPAGQKLVGLTSDDDARSKTIYDFVVDEERERLAELVEVVMRDSTWDGQANYRNFQTGEVVPMLQHAFVIRVPGGERPVALATISVDVSQRERSGRELVALKDELATELTAMTQLHEFGSLLLTSDEVETVFEAALDAIMSLQGADMGLAQLYTERNETLTSVVHRGLNAEFQKLVTGPVDGRTACGRAILERRRVVIEDVDLDERFGALLPAAHAAGFRAVQSTPLFSREGEPLGAITTYFRKPHRPSDRDLRLTDLYARQAAAMIERNRTEQALQRSEFYLAEGEKISHTGSWSFDVAIFDIFSSRENLRLFGLNPDRDRPSYLDYYALMHPEDREEVQVLFERAVAERNNFNHQYRIILPDQAIRVIHGQARPLFDTNGKLIEFVGTNTDVTARKHAEEALRRAQSELAHLNRAMTMGELTASIAHEISQPLTAVVANAQACVRWLSANPPNVREATNSAESIARDAMRATDVVARIRALLVRADPVKINLPLDDVLLEVVSLVQSQARAHGVAVRLSLASDLPLVWGDRVQVQQVVLNLVINAIEAMRAFTGRPRELEITAQRFDARQVHVLVRDSGPGLDSTHRDRIFDSFYTTKTQGMGMGLAISRSIVRAHGGQLWATGNPEGGETFHCTFPMTESPET